MKIYLILGLRFLLIFGRERDRQGRSSRNKRLDHTSAFLRITPSNMPSIPSAEVTSSTVSSAHPQRADEVLASCLRQLTFAVRDVQFGMYMTSI